MNKHVLIPWVKDINAKLAGEAEVKLFMGGALGRNPTKQYKLVKDKVADIAYIVNAYTPGDFPDTSIFQLPFLMDSATEGSVAHWRAYRQGLLRGYDKVKILSLFTIAQQSIHTKRSITKIADLKGLKIRAAGPYQSASLGVLGATPVGRIPVTKVAQALSSGVVDGTLSDWVGMYIFRIVNLAKYHFEIPLGAAPGAIVMNKSTYNGLSAKVRKIIDANSGAGMSRAPGIAFDRLYKVFYNKTRKDKSHNFIIPSAAERAALKKRLAPVTAKWIKRNPEGQKRYDAVQAILRDLRK